MSQNRLNSFGGQSQSASKFYQQWGCWCCCFLFRSHTDRVGCCCCCFSLGDEARWACQQFLIQRATKNTFRVIISNAPSTHLVDDPFTRRREVVARWRKSDKYDAHAFVLRDIKLCAVVQGRAQNCAKGLFFERF